MLYGISVLSFWRKYDCTVYFVRSVLTRSTCTDNSHNLHNQNHWSSHLFCSDLIRMTTSLCSWIDPLLKVLKRRCECFTLKHKCVLAWENLHTGNVWHFLYSSEHYRLSWPEICFSTTVNSWHFKISPKSIYLLIFFTFHFFFIFKNDTFYYGKSE